MQTSLLIYLRLEKTPIVDSIGCFLHTNKATRRILLFYPTMRTFGAPCIRCCWRKPDLAFCLSASWHFSAGIVFRV